MGMSMMSVQHGWLGETLKEPKPPSCAPPWKKSEQELARKSPFPLHKQTTDSNRDCGFAWKESEREKKQALLDPKTADGLTT